MSEKIDINELVSLFEIDKINFNTLSVLLWNVSFNPLLSKEGRSVIQEEAKRLRATYSSEWQRAVRTLLARNYKIYYKNLCSMYGERCVICGEFKEGLQIDHIKPVSLGGDNRMENLQLLCSPCNRKKSNKFNKEIWI